MNPRIVVAVMVDEPSNGSKYFGGDVAAPVFAQVVQQTLRTMGDAAGPRGRPQIVARALRAEEESF